MSDQAFRRLIEEYGSLISRTLRHYESEPSRHEELVQEAAIALWRALPRFRGEAGLKTYVMRVVHNVGVSHIRRAVSRPRHDLLDEEFSSDAASPEEAADDAMKRRRLQSAISTLRLDQRQAILLHLEGFTNEEIARVMGCSEGAAAIRVSRARAALKAQILAPVNGG